MALAADKTYVQPFEQGGREFADLLGGKGANLAEMTRHLRSAHAEVLLDGSVRLSGSVHRRGDVAGVHHTVLSVDGITDVVDELAWAIDDLQPLPG